MCPVGLVIHPQHHFLAASADGLVQSEGNIVGLVEVKNLLSDKNITLAEATKRVKTFCLHLNGNKLELEKKQQLLSSVPGADASFTEAMGGFCCVFRESVSIPC